MFGKRRVLSTAVLLVAALAALQRPTAAAVRALGPARHATEPALAPRLHASGSPTARAHAPELTFIDQPTPVQRQTISWAVDRFVDAGLQLPDLEIKFPVFCNGKGALYHVGHSSIDFCRLHRKNVLHEFAHAWDDTSGAVDREGFMDLRDVTVWFGGLDLPVREQGSEHLAIIVAWGLMDPGTGSAHGLPNSSDTELAEAFVFLTGESGRENRLISDRQSHASGPIVVLRAAGVVAPRPTADDHRLQPSPTHAGRVSTRRVHLYRWYAVALGRCRSPRRRRRLRAT